MATGTNEGIDPLEFFQRLEHRSTKPDVDEKDYPGSTPPRTPEQVDTREEDWLNSLPFQEFTVPGKGIVKFYSIGSLACALGKQPVTIRSWESKGWLPAAGFRTAAPRAEQLPGKVTKGRRLYSQEQVVFLAKAYEKYVLNPRKPNWAGFRNHIKTQYPR